MPGESSMFPFEVPKELYQSFLITYGVSSVGRMAVEAYKQLAVLETAWYDILTPVLAVLEQGFVQHALLSLAAAEVLNMVLGALYKNRVRREARDAALAEGRAEGIAEGRAQGHAEGQVEGHAQGHAEGQAEGHAQGHAEGQVNRDKVWREWLRRKAEAEANGQTFTEPAPDEEPQR